MILRANRRVPGWHQRYQHRELVESRLLARQRAGITLESDEQAFVNTTLSLRLFNQRQGTGLTRNHTNHSVKNPQLQE